jgi:ATP-dependent DNA helicase UvrD/PcrA
MFDEHMFEEKEEISGGQAHSLNPAQQAAVLHAGGPLLVVAGAGTGKTKTLVARLAHLIATGEPAERILLLTFTRRAAKEMIGRARRLTGDESIARVWGGTFHSVANRSLRKHAQVLALPPNFTVVDASDCADLMDLERSSLAIDKRSRRFPKKETLTGIYSAMVSSGEALSTVLKHSFPWCSQEAESIRSIFEGYTGHKRAQGLLDYDDLLLYWRALLRTRGCGANAAFSHVLVDEYQDTNSIQCDILEAFDRGGARVMAVGDDAQAIYSFRSATAANMAEFTERFPGARTILLERNYRSTQPLLDVSNEVMRAAAGRVKKELWTERTGIARPTLVTCGGEREQSDAVCERVLDHREQGTALKSQAVLFRAAHHSAGLELELSRRNIPFVKYGGLRFLESAHIKDLLAFMRLLENPWDQLSWLRVLKLLEGFGPATARKAMLAIGLDSRPAEGSPAGPSPALRLLQPDVTAIVPNATLPEWNELDHTIQHCLLPELRSRPDLRAERIARFYAPLYDRKYDDPSSRLNDLTHLKQLAEGYESCERFISELTLDPAASTSALAGPPLLDDDYLILSTIHSAKGGEWDVVHVIHAADGMIPSDMAIRDDDGLEEERRVFYVALTRARDMLHVYFPLRYYFRPQGMDDAHGYGRLTRFISSEIRALFDHDTEDGAQAGLDSPVTEGVGLPERVDAQLAELWSG